MDLNSTLLQDFLNKLNNHTTPKWGIMNSSQMLYHCNTFINVSFIDLSPLANLSIYKRFGFSTLIFLM